MLTIAPGLEESCICESTSSTFNLHIAQARNSLLIIWNRVAFLREIFSPPTANEFLSSSSSKEYCGEIMWLSRIRSKKLQHLLSLKTNIHHPSIRSYCRLVFLAYATLTMTIISLSLRPSSATRTKTQNSNFNRTIWRALVEKTDPKLVRLEMYQTRQCCSQCSTCFFGIIIIFTIRYFSQSTLYTKWISHRAQLEP